MCNRNYGRCSLLNTHSNSVCQSRWNVNEILLQTLFFRTQKPWNPYKNVPIDHVATIAINKKIFSWKHRMRIKIEEKKCFNEKFINYKFKSFANVLVTGIKTVMVVILISNSSIDRFFSFHPLLSIERQ